MGDICFNKKQITYTMKTIITFIIFLILTFSNKVNSQSNKFNNPPVIQNENYAIEITDIKAEKKSCSFKVRIKNNSTIDFIQLNPYMIGGFKNKETIFYPSSKKTLRTLNRSNKWIIEPNKSSSKIITLPTGEFLNAEEFSIIIKQFSIGEWDDEVNRILVSPLDVFSPDKKAENEKRRLKQEKKLAKANRKRLKRERSKAKNAQKVQFISDVTATPNNANKKSLSNIETQTSLNENITSTDNTESLSNKLVSFKITYKEKGICGWYITIVQDGLTVCSGLTNSSGEFAGTFTGKINKPIVIKGQRGKKEFNLSEFYYVKHLSETNLFEIKQYMNALKSNSLNEIAQSSNEYAIDKEGIDQMNNVMDAQSDMIETVREDRKKNPTMMGEEYDKEVDRDLAKGAKIFKGAHTVARVGMYSKYLTNNKSKKELIKLKTMRLTKCL